MKGDTLPDADHVVRYVKPTLIHEEGRPEGGAFCLRPGESGLSVNWLEAFPGDKRAQMQEVRRVFRLSVSRNGRFGELNVGQVTRKIAEEMASVRIEHDPLDATDDFPQDPSHAEITGLPPGETDEATLIGDLIAECVIEKMHPAVD